jgi:hypothetical protein
VLTLAGLEFPVTASQNSQTNQNLFFTFSFFLIHLFALPRSPWCRFTLDEQEDSKCHTYCIPKNRGEIHQCWFDEMV